MQNKKIPFSNYVLKKEGVAAGKIGTAELIALSFFENRLRIPLPSWRKKFRGLCFNAGFFPCTMEAVQKWNLEMRSAISETKYILKWQKEPKLRKIENQIISKCAPFCEQIGWESVGLPIISEILKFRVLVVSPFFKTMEKQIEKIQLIHPSIQNKIEPSVLKENVQFLKCPLHWHLETSPFKTWHDGLEKLAESARKKVFDIAIIGAGAWSLPLAARIKQTGRVAIHTGGETQLFFGIKGKRWDNYGFYNSSWISPLPEETPCGRKEIDDGCYW